MKTISLPIPELAPKECGFFRYGVFGDDFLLSNDAGEWQFVSKKDFHLLLSGSIKADHPQYSVLREKGFIREGLDVEELAQKVRLDTFESSAVRRPLFVSSNLATRLGRGKTSASTR